MFFQKSQSISQSTVGCLEACEPPLHFLEISASKNVREVKIIDEGIYPYVKREYELIEKGSVKKFRVAAPFRVICKELEQLKILVNGEGIKRIKESEGNYRFELPER